MLLSLDYCKSCSTGPCSKGQRRVRNITAAPINSTAAANAMTLCVRVKRGFDVRPPSGAFPVSAAEDMNFGVRFHTRSCCGKLLHPTRYPKEKPCSREQGF